MPRKPKFTKEEVLTSAFEVARKQGIEAVTAASVAANMGYTGSSLFTHFESMDEIKQEVHAMARGKAIDFFDGSIDYFPAFKEFGMRWIRFAKNEPNLYRMIFAGNPLTPAEDVFIEFSGIIVPICKEVEETFGISAENAKKLSTSCITQANGIALAIINGFGEDYTEEKVGEDLSNMCIGMVLLFKVKDETISLDMAKKLVGATTKMPVHK